MYIGNSLQGTPSLSAFRFGEGIVARRKRYDPAKLQIELLEERRATWDWFREGRAGGRRRRKSVSGRETVYRVFDANFDRLNAWTFVIQVPAAATTPVIVRPRNAPGRLSWASIDRRSIAFVRAKRRAYRGKLYCKVPLADPTGKQTKHMAHRTERRDLPKWMDYFRSAMRVKDTVTTTKARDGDQQVLVVRPDDHHQMIRIFFATKVWVLQEKFEL